MNYKSYNLGDWIGHISGVIEDESELDGNEMRDLVEFLSKMPRWIPVSERLPRKDEYGDVLVTFIPAGGTLWTTVIIAHYSDLMGIAKPCFYIGDVGKNDFENITEQVTAWQSLPEPYKAEGEE